MGARFGLHGTFLSAFAVSTMSNIATLLDHAFQPPNCTQGDSRAFATDGSE
jgi:hypothetical protein